MFLTRRFFLQSTGAAAVYLGLTPMEALAVSARRACLGPLPRVPRGKALVVLFLRGGADGLNLVVPYGDPAYARLRPTIAIPAPGTKPDGSAIDLDGYFGLHPRFDKLGPLFDSGLAVAAHAVGYDKNTRSHFEEQDTWETGIVGNTIHSDGWLNRHLLTSEGNGPIRAVAIGNSLPRILYGKAAAFAVRGVEDLALPKTRADPDAVAAALEHAYCTQPREHASAAADLLSQSAKTTLEGIKQLKAIGSQPYAPKAPYPETELGKKLLQVARLIKADVGMEVAEIDLGGWDTHQAQGGAAGAQANLAQQVGDALAAFAADLEEKMNEVVVVTLTDFGRTAAENGTFGTDHGWANCMFLLGGPVARANAQARSAGKPRKVVTDWPGLAPDQLHQKRDLAHTTDFRDVLGEIVKVHLGNEQLQAVLPQHEFKPVGLVAV